MPSPKKPLHRQPNDVSRVATNALMRGMSHWGLNQTEVGEIIGLSTSQISKFARSEGELDANSKAFELALLVLRAFRSLDALVGGENDLAREWLHRPNTALNAVPLDLMKSVQGLVETVEYLDQRRAPL